MKDALKGLFTTRVKRKYKKKHVELFPGSITDLGKLTGKTYKVMKDGGDLVKIEANDCNKGYADNCLYRKAVLIGADAVVHVT